MGRPPVPRPPSRVEGEGGKKAGSGGKQLQRTGSTGSLGAGGAGSGGSNADGGAQVRGECSGFGCGKEGRQGSHSRTDYV
jgi:hypothetical protein